jgi:hypothetical protein
MSLCLSIIALCGSLFIAAPIQSRQDTLRVTLSVVTPGSTGGAPLVLRATVWNDTDHPVQVIAPLDWPNESLVLEVIGPDGNLLRALNYVFPNAIPVGPDAEFATRVPPHSFVGHDFDLSSGLGTGRAGYSITQPGIYRASLTVVIYSTGEGPSTLLHSNTIHWAVE